MASRAAPGSAVPVHRVVVGIDGSDASDRASPGPPQKRSRTGAVLEGHCSQGVGYLFTPRDEAQTASQKTIDEAADRVADIAPGVTFKGVTHEGPAAKNLIDASEGADLLVVGSRGAVVFVAFSWGRSVSSAPCMPDVQS